MKNPARMAGPAVVLLAAACGACATTGAYRCPEPIGEIIRDDCDAYQTRYEAARVKLGAGIGPAKVEGEFTKQALHDPSELIQVMGARMVALCHDFNACRLTPQDYQRRREEIDKSMTAIMALGEQLRRTDLKDDERRLLLEKLMRMVGEPPARVADGGQKPPARDDKPQEKERKRFFSSSNPWFGSTMLPPQPPPAAEGFPRLVRWGRGTLDHVWVPRSADKPHHKKIGGYAPRVRVVLWGHLEADDRLEIRFQGKKKFRCPVRKNGDGVFSIGCKPPKGFALNDESFSYQVAYHRAMADEWKVLGRVERQVARWEQAYRLDHAGDVEEGWVSFLPEPRGLPADFERPHLHVTLQLRGYEKATARCFVGDQAVTPALKTSRGTGQTGSIQDRPRYRQVKPGHSRAVKHPFLEWWHYEFPLPFVVPRARGEPPEGLALWPPKTGDWRCRVMVEGAPVRELLFRVGDDGKLAPIEGQRAEPGDLVHPWWRVETTVLPNKVEAVRGDPGVST